MTKKNAYKILILTADAGFGHRSAANAIEKALQQTYGDQIETLIVNPLDHPKAPEMLKESQSDYDEIVKNLPDLYEMGYKASDSTLPVTIIEAGLIVMLFEAFREILQEHQPDLVINTYPVYQAPLDAITSLREGRVPWITTITDLVTVHRIWFHKGAALCMVPTEEVQKRALRAGLNSKQVVISGIPVDPRISELKSRNKSAVLAELGWKQNLTSVLVVGSTRVPKLMDIIDVIDHSGYDLQIALIAGGNEPLFNQFQEVDWHHFVKIYNFVEDMPTMMRAADLIICKAGGLIVTESLASELPLMIIHALPGQEAGNVDFVVKHKAGEFCDTPLKALRTLSHWLMGDQTKLIETAKHAAAIGKAKAAFEVAKNAWDLLTQPPEDVDQKTKARDAARIKSMLDRFKIPWSRF